MLKSSGKYYFSLSHSFCPAYWPNHGRTFTQNRSASVPRLLLCVHLTAHVLLLLLRDPTFVIQLFEDKLAVMHARLSCSNSDEADVSRAETMYDALRQCITR